MKTPQIMLKKVGKFLVDRCQELGYVPLVTKIPPPNKVFIESPSEEAVFIKLFGNFNFSINTVHAKFGVLDPKNLKNLGGLGDENLTLTEMDKYLLLLQFVDLSDKELKKIIKDLHSLQQLYDLWKTSEKSI